MSEYTDCENCDCIERAEAENGGNPVKNYQCLGKTKEMLEALEPFEPKARKEIKSHLADLKFTKWLLELCEDWEPDMIFLFENPFAEEMEEWYRWYKQGMTPQEAAQENYRLYA